MKYWLMKSEEEEYSIYMLEKDKWSSWFGVRNYQARNFMRDEMKVGDKILFYHSNGNPSAVVGVARVASVPHADETAFDAKSKYYDPKSTREKPTWQCVDVEFVSKFKTPLSLQEIKDDEILSAMLVAQKGQRLSIQPVLKEHFDEILIKGKKK